MNHPRDSVAAAPTATIATYFSRIRVAPDHPWVRPVHGDLQSLHQFVMRGFHGQLPHGTTDVRAKLAVLYAAKREPPTSHARGLHGGAVNGILVQSRARPDWQDLVTHGAITVEQVTVNRWTWASGDVVAIRTWVNAVTAHDSSHERRGIRDPNAAAEWMRTTMARKGCVIHDESLQVDEGRYLSSSRPRFGLILRPFRFAATVTDPHAFADAVVHGIGKGKAYGAGLLHVHVT